MASYKVLIKPSAVKELESLPKNDRRRVAEKIKRLAVEPRPHGCEKLSGEEKYRLRRGSYRSVYSIEDSEHIVLVVKIGRRREVYR